MLLSFNFYDVYIIMSRHVIGNQSRIGIIIIIIIICYPILTTSHCLPLLQADLGRVCVFLWRAE